MKLSKKWCLLFIVVCMKSSCDIYKRTVKIQFEVTLGHSLAIHFSVIRGVKTGVLSLMTLTLSLIKNDAARL
jgi:hypothetical protein